MSRRGQPALFDAVPVLAQKRRRKGPIELAALADLRAMKAAGVLPPNSRALQLNFRLAAQNVDLASALGDPYAVVAASRELAARRAQLGALDGPVAENVAEEIHARLSAEIRNAS